MNEQIEALKLFLKEQNLSRFAKEAKVKRAVLYDFLKGKNIRIDHFLKILQGTGFKIQIPDWSRFQLEKIPFDQSKRLHLLRLLDLIVEKYDPQKIVLFGSQATGKWSRNSDFDFALIDIGIRNTRGSLLQYAIGEGIHITFDYFAMTSDQLANDDSINSVEYAVKTEGHIIYERDEPSQKSKR